MSASIQYAHINAQGERFKDHAWRRRQAGKERVVARMPSVNPKDTERFFLKLLLLHIYEDLRTQVIMSYLEHSERLQQHQVFQQMIQKTLILTNQRNHENVYKCKAVSNGSYNLIFNFCFYRVRRQQMNLTMATIIQEGKIPNVDEHISEYIEIFLHFKGERVNISISKL